MFPSATDLYLRGNNILGFTGDSGTSFQVGGIYFPNNYTRRIWTSKALNFSGYTKLNVELIITKASDYTQIPTIFFRFFYKIFPPALLGSQGAFDYDFRTDYLNVKVNALVTLSVNLLLPTITHFGFTLEFSASSHSLSGEGYIYRIWIS